MRLFSTGRYLLNSGIEADWIIDCRALSKYDWEALAVIAMERFDLFFGSASGVPSGGIDFGKAMMRHYSSDAKDRWLICDDVYTTGNSIKHAKQRLLANNPKLEIHGLVAFARTKPKEKWIDAIWEMG